MKNTYFLLTLLFTSIIKMAAQDSDIRDGRHIFNYPITLTACDFDGTTTVTTQRMERNMIFTVDNILASGDYIINLPQFSPGSDDAEQKNARLNRDTTTGQLLYFRITQNQYKSVAQRIKKKGSFRVGASTTLVKIRPGNNKEGEDKISSDFGSDFNLGLTAGWRFAPFIRSDFSISAVAGFGFSSIKVTPQTTRNFIESDATQSCITLHGGLVWEIEKFQISTFAGYDIMSGEVGENWIYRNRPWFGVGFGYQIFQDRPSDTQP